VRTFIASSAIDSARDRQKKGMRYEHSFKLRCVMLKMKSNEAYVHLRANGLLPLPSLSTIRRILSSSECKFGFNALALEHISESLKGVEEHKRWGTLMWDEISITKDLRFDTRTLKWKGIVDFAGETTIMVPNGIADHVLVFVFRPFHAGWIQPFAWFGTKGGAQGTILQELVLKGLAALHQAGAIAKACVSDGYSTNKMMMTLYGVSGEEHGKNYITNPLNHSIKIYFLVDVPHLMKCVRNHMKKHHTVQV
jgi:hypothetical protein